jgi:hypothetical protein
MSLIFIDGFDHYATADLPKKWNAAGASVAIAASSGRRSGGAMTANTTSTTANLTKNITTGASFVCGFALNVGAFPTAAVPVVGLLDAATNQCDLRVNPDGTLSVTRNATSLTGGTSTFALSSGTFFYIEFKCTIADSIGASSCKVRVNGVDVITVATGQDTKNTANASANQVRLGTNANVTAGTWLFDDFYICDTTGSTNNDFLGDVRIEALLPTSDGTYSQFTPSTGTSHFALVDESTPNTTDYNDGVTVGHRDSYGFGDLTALASQVVYGVQVNAAVMKDDAGTKSVAAMARSGGTDADGASVALTTSQLYATQIFETNPNGAVAWTEATVNAAEFGVKVTA